MPKSVLNCTLTVSQGKYAFDPVSKVLSWDVGKMEAQRASPNMRGTVKHRIKMHYFSSKTNIYFFFVQLTLQSTASIPESNPTISVGFVISQMAISGLKVSRLDLFGEKYKPFKGVKYMTKAGRFQVRM